MAAVKGLPAIPSLGPDVSLNRYLAEIRKFPILAPQEEYMLAKRWREHQDPEAAARLVTSHLRLVAKIAMGYRGYGLRSEEHTSELQSLMRISYAVFCLKKKTTTKHNSQTDRRNTT